LFLFAIRLYHADAATIVLFVLVSPHTLRRHAMYCLPGSRFGRRLP